jgi:hypothetical protein
VILLDLRTGRSEVLDLGSRWTAWVDWRDDGRSLVVGHGLRSRSELVELPSRRRTTLPWRYWRAAFAPDGRQLSTRVRKHDELEVLEWQDGRPVSVARVWVPGLRSSPDATGLLGPDVTQQRLLVQVNRPDRRYSQLVVLDRATYEVEARLVVRYLSARWLDARTVLLETERGLLTWRPSDGAFRRVTDLPRSGIGTDGYWSLDVAVQAAAR